MLEVDRDRVLGGQIPARRLHVSRELLDLVLVAALQARRGVLGVAPPFTGDDRRQAALERLAAGRGLAPLLALARPLRRRLRLRQALLGAGQRLRRRLALDAPLLAVELEVAAVLLEPERPHLDDPVHAGEQPAIVADDDQPLAPRADQLVDGGARAAIELVRGLVEQQELWLVEQQPGQAHARALAVAQAAE